MMKKIGLPVKRSFKNNDDYFKFIKLNPTTTILKVTVNKDGIVATIQKS